MRHQGSIRSRLEVIRWPSARRELVDASLLDDAVVSTVGARIVAEDRSW
jgi:hypothetical protein